MNQSLRIEVIDSHTGGEPTRIVMQGGPDLGHGPLMERRARFQPIDSRPHSHLGGAQRFIKVNQVKR